MCGISGIFHIYEPGPLPKELLYGMIALQRHRGPDESGAYFDSRVALGHTRLAIIGLDGGTQPIGNEDGSLWIVYNGEAFNYIELRRDLERRGHRMTTATDTEVVLHLYEEFGPACLERINGQFALAIWDARKQELFLARDRMGVRPLYYARCGDRLLFASEIKALLLDPELPREFDPEALAQVFTFWTTLSPRTVFRGIRELPPGCSLTIRDGRFEERTWWRLPNPAADDLWRGSFAEARDEVAELLKDAVRIRLRADVPVGSYLSGGLDSSILASLASDFIPPGGLRTFSMSFEESAFDETSFQEQMVRHLKTEHSQVLISSEAIRRHFAETLWHCERPLLRTAPVPLLLLSRLASRSGYKVVLTGEGADEVFGGYNIFKEAKIRAFWARRPESRLRPRLLERLYPYVFRNPSRGSHFLRHYFAVTGEDAHDPLLSHRVRWENGVRNLVFLADDVRSEIDPTEALAPLLPRDFADRGVLERAQWLEMTIFLSDYLLSSQGDRVAMAGSLEVRHPFLDVRLVELAARLPPRWKIFALREKHILKEAFRHRLPTGIGNRSKQPYRAPVREVFFGDPPDPLLTHLLSDEALRTVGMFHSGRVERLIRKFSKGPTFVTSENEAMAITGILSTQVLHHRFLSQPLWPDEIRPPDRVVFGNDAVTRERRSSLAAGGVPC